MQIFLYIDIKIFPSQSVLSESAPFLITAALAFLGAVPGLFLPETADLKMPDTLEVSWDWRRRGHVTHCSPLIG